MFEKFEDRNNPIAIEREERKMTCGGPSSILFGEISRSCHASVRSWRTGINQSLLKGKKGR
jgi:hypothetical protein